VSALNRPAEWVASSAAGAGLAFNVTRAASPNRRHVITGVVIVCTAAAPAAPVLVQINDGTGLKDLTEFSARGIQVLSFGSGWPVSAENTALQVVSGVPGGAVLATCYVLGYTV
jgi:hypothetical protein